MAGGMTATENAQQARKMRRTRRNPKGDEGGGARPRIGAWLLSDCDYARVVT